MLMNREYLIRLREGVTHGLLHEESILISTEYCISRESFYLNLSYVATTLIPYFDLLHDYVLMEVNAGVHKYILRRSEVLGVYTL